MLRCIARVAPLEKRRCKRPGEEFLIELDCDNISEAEVRAERYALQNERDIQEKLRELALRRKIYCCRRHRHGC